jgi:hypothetical protein
MAGSICTSYITFWRHIHIAQTGKINANLIWVAAPFMVRIHAAIFAEEVFCDVFVPLVGQKVIFACQQRKMRLMFGLHHDGFLLT